MNKVILVGRLTKDPAMHGTETKVAKYTLAVDRKYKKEGEQTADFISCVCFGKSAEFVEKYCHKGIKLAVEGRIQTGSYTKDDGSTVYTTDVVVESQEFVESKSKDADNTSNNEPATFLPFPDDDSDIPF